jgi:hypothetical protein
MIGKTHSIINSKLNKTQSAITDHRYQRGTIDAVNIHITYLHILNNRLKWQGS